MSSELPCQIHYHLVYSVIDEGYTTWPFAAAGLIFVIAGLLALRFSKKRWSAWSLLLFAVFWCTTAFVATYREYATLRNALRDGTATLVEGPVVNFSPEPALGHAPERFDVAGTHFAYQGVGGVSAAFNRSKPKGGPIREGVQVRIWHVQGKIARLELGDRVCP